MWRLWWETLLSQLKRRLLQSLVFKILFEYSDFFSIDHQINIELIQISFCKKVVGVLWRKAFSGSRGIGFSPGKWFCGFHFINIEIMGSSMHNFAHCKKEEKIKREKKKKKTNMHICTLHIEQVEREVLRPHQRLLPLLQVIQPPLGILNNDTSFGEQWWGQDWDSL